MDGNSDHVDLCQFRFDYRIFFVKTQWTNNTNAPSTPTQAGHQTVFQHKLVEKCSQDMHANQDVTKTASRLMQTLELLGQCFIRPYQSGHDQSKKRDRLACCAQRHPTHQWHAQHERIQRPVAHLRRYM